MKFLFLVLILMTVFYSNTFSAHARGPEVIEIVIDETISVGTDNSNQSNQIDENIQIKDENTTNTIEHEEKE
ncbi:MAG: hypothetical protein MK345_06535, partial [SAR202 cluster bacterium]|nr:hypothetical protein [SAR202 cluster bacterium]